MRLQTLYLVDVQLQSKDRYRTVERLMPFPWDKEKIEQQDFDIPSQEDFLEFDKVITNFNIDELEQ